MNWEILFNMQKQLDSYIEDNHKLSDRDLFDDKYLALLVELGELANETRCFKFWSNKPRSESDVILEEYVDGVHFILSLGIVKGFTYSSTDHKSSEQTETELFNDVFERCVVFKNDTTQANYNRLFAGYLILGQKLGFSEEDVHQAYVKKNEVNYERQNSGY
jgi:dimeric dUTPase (all-alpha-NTP-PPase superfamily)